MEGRRSAFCWLAGLLLVLSGVPAARPAAAVFRAEAGKMLFVLEYAGEAPEITALFRDRGDRVELRLPAAGLKTPLQNRSLDDEWVSGYGLEKSAGGRVWYLCKRRPQLKLKPRLALEHRGRELEIVLLKPYRPWVAPAAGAGPGSEPAVTDSVAAKVARVGALLEPGSAGRNGPKTGQKGGERPGRSSLMAAGLRTLGALLLLVLIIFVLALVLKRWRRRRGGGIGQGRLIRLLGSEPLLGRHQIALFELGSQILVVGLSGDNMTLLMTISDPAEVEELRLLRGENPIFRGFGGVLRNLLGQKPAAIAEDDSTAGTGSAVLTEEEPAPEAGFGTREPGLEPVCRRSVAEPASPPVSEDDLPENYRDVVSQIKSRLHQRERR